jgi:hypothetical protein
LAEYDGFQDADETLLQELIQVTDELLAKIQRRWHTKTNPAS